MMGGRRGSATGMASVALAAAFAAGASVAAQDWTAIDLGTLGGPGSYGAAVSDTGFVAGCSDVPSGGAHAFIYHDGVMRDLGTGGDAGDGSSCALAVNDLGVAAGRSSAREIVIWNGKSVTHLGVQGTVGAVNDAGVVVGAYQAGASERAFMYSRGVLKDLGTLGDGSGPYANSAATSINVRDQVVGSSNGHAFLYEDGAMRDLATLGGNGSSAKDINDRGVVVGMAADANGEPLPFVYDATMRALPGPAGSGAIAINDRGQVVGSGEGIHGYLIDGGIATRLDLLPAVIAKGWRRLEPTGINDRGWIVGTAVNADGNLRAFLLVPGGGGGDGILKASAPARGGASRPGD